MNDTPALPRSIIAGAGPQDPNVDQLRAERRELAHWLRLITAKRDLIAARVVPPLTQLQLAGTAATIGGSCNGARPKLCSELHNWMTKSRRGS